MAYTFGTLTPEEFDAFSAGHPQGNFQQTSSMGAVRAKQGTQVEYLGVRKDGELVAAALFELHKSKLSSFAEIHDGPLVDYHDKELLSFFVGKLKEHADAKGAAQLNITPEVVYRAHDNSGKELAADGGERPKGTPDFVAAGADDQTVSNLLELGFLHDGFTTGYGAVPRWRFIKDLTGMADEDALMQSYTPDRRRNVRIARDSFVTIEYATRDKLALFHQIYQYCCSKYNYESRPLSYYEAIFDEFGDNARFGIASIDLGAYRDAFTAKRDSIQQEIDKLEQTIEKKGATPKLERRLKDANDRYATAGKRIETAERLIGEDGLVVPIDVDLFVWHERECVGLFAASNPKYTQFCATALIQHLEMLECLRRGVTRYNSYGITGVFDDPEDPGFGVLSFKQRFLGYIEEMVGSFTLPVKPLAFKAKQMAHKILGH